MNYAIILAGGVGSRFWPLSRESQPKQFLNICSRNTLLKETLYRISSVVSRKNIYLAGNRIQESKINKCLRGAGIPRANIFFEPCGKNTLAPITVLSRKIYSGDKEAIIAVLPSDHFIGETARFSSAIAKAFRVARRGYIVTMGIRPDHPETGYGYIKAGPKIKIPKAGPCYRSERFIEKPGIAKAKALIKDRRYYWNSGMFIFKAEVMLQEIRRLAPRTYRLTAGINNKKDITKTWPRLASLYIDYAVMEKTAKAVVLPADYTWTDLGSWQAWEEIMPKDKRGNIFKGNNCFDLGSSNSLIWSGRRLVATVGLRDIIIVDTDDALLVCHRDRAQDVKRLVESFKKKRLRKYL